VRRRSSACVVWPWRVHHATLRPRHTLTHAVCTRMCVFCLAVQAGSRGSRRQQCQGA
jgi:hypothetical protein